MTQYAQVQGGRVLRIGLPEVGTLADGRQVSGYSRLAPSVLAAEGWQPYTESRPAIDPETQTVALDSYTITPDGVIGVYRAVPLPPVPPTIDAVVDELRTRSLPADSSEWRQPAGYFDAYPIGTQVTHSGKTWVATQDGAAGEPGVDDGWREVPLDGQSVEWVAPHAGEEYAPGALVTHNGHTWRNDMATPNGFEPGAQGSGWTDLGETAA